MDDRPSTSGSADTSNTDVDSRFIRHKVTKLDTLAGLAVKYGVSVSDIKRANGLMSDTAVFALEYVLIPKDVLPVGEDVQLMLAQLVSGLGRDPHLNSDTLRHPGSTAMAMASGTAHSRATGRVDSAFLQGLGLLRIDESDSMDQPQELASMSSGWILDWGQTTPALRRVRSHSDPGDVELSERSSGEVIPSWEGNGQDGAVRRRRRNDGQDPDGCSNVFDTWWGGQENGTNGQHPSTGHPHEASDASRAQYDFFSKLTRTFNESSLVKSIRKAASQPALATANPLSIADMADAVLASRAAPPTARRMQATRMQEPLLPPSTLLQRRKDGGKDE